MMPYTKIDENNDEMAIIMTNQISQTIENWQTMSIAECLSFVDDLIFHASDEEETLAILHELFFQEVNGRGDETLIDALASAILSLWILPPSKSLHGR